MTQAISRHTILCMVRHVRHDRHAWAFRHGVPYLISWLNETEDREAKARISRLHQLCTEALETSWTTTQKEWMKGKAKFRKLEGLARAINRITDQYVGYRRVLCASDGHVMALWHSAQRSRESEFHCVDCLLDLFEQKGLSRVRVCECGMYFYARSSLSRFCSKTCREGFWEKSEIRKEQKRIKAQEYYWLHKNKNVK